MSSVHLESNFHSLHYRHLDGFLQHLIVRKGGGRFRDGLGEANEGLQEAGAWVAGRRQARVARQLEVEKVVHVLVLLKRVVERAVPQAGETVEELQVRLGGQAQVHVVAGRAIDGGRGRVRDAAAMA